MNKVLFWDFHGTLSYPDKISSINIYKVAIEKLPSCNITLEKVIERIDNDGFPWNHPERSYLEIRSPDLWWEYVNKLYFNTYLRCGLTDEEAKFLTPFVRDRILDIKNFRLYEQAENTLKVLKEMGYHHILLSNNYPELEQLCDELKISQYFDDFVVSAIVGYEKPRKEIFDIALKKADNPEICFMIGDNPIADIEGAKNAGIKSILVNNQAKSCADYSCKSLDDIIVLLNEIENYSKFI